MKRNDHIPHLVRVLGGAMLALLAFGVGGSAALASPSLVPGSGGTVVVPVRPGTVRIVTVGGIAGWQVTLIALVAALFAAAAAVAIDRALAARRLEPTTAK